MTLPANKRRNIVVDGRKFHWTPGRKDDHGWITIQDATGAGAHVIIDPVWIMRPADVADAIRFAIANGWTPGVSGPPVYLGFCEPPLPVRFVVRTAGAGNYWQEV
jgi:hypothetical protein